MRLPSVSTELGIAAYATPPGAGITRARLAILDAAGLLFILSEATDDTPAPWRRHVV